MESDSSSGWQGKGALEELMRERIRTTIKGIIDEELVAALGAARSQRSGPVRVGYRHGKRSRTLTTSLGPTTIAMPRARLEGEDGRPLWSSAISTTRDDLSSDRGVQDQCTRAVRRDESDRPEAVGTRVTNQSDALLGTSAPARR
jgi:hypothetical protein